MKPKNPSINLVSSLLIIYFPFLISSQACQKNCGNLPVRYPFGTGPGCGDPRFEPYVTCSQQQLTFTTHTGCYTVTSIDYTSQVINIYDPTLSTCSCKFPGKGFGLDWDAPFSFNDDTVFTLLDCSTSSPIYRAGGGDNSSFPMCDSQGGSICSLLYSCEAISRLSLPVSSCCVYTPVDLGPSFDMNLRKLQCGSYSALIGFNGQESNPGAWTYGIALKYKFNFNNDYPELCASCEKSNGVCSFNDDSYKSFACICPGGLKTTADCFYGGSWSYGSRFLPWQTWILSVFCFIWFILVTIM